MVEVYNNKTPLGSCVRRWWCERELCKQMQEHNNTETKSEGKFLWNKFSSRFWVEGKIKYDTQSAVKYRWKLQFLFVFLYHTWLFERLIRFFSWFYFCQTNIFYVTSQMLLELYLRLESWKGQFTNILVELIFCGTVTFQLLKLQSDKPIK